MKRIKSSQKFFNRRSFLCSLVASVSFYTAQIFLCKLFLPSSLIAQENKPSPPGFGGEQSDEKIVLDTEIIARVKEASDKWDENSEKHDGVLTPDQQEAKREEIEKALRDMVASKGYKIQAPTNFRIID